MPPSRYWDYLHHHRIARLIARCVLALCLALWASPALIAAPPPTPAQDLLFDAARLGRADLVPAFVAQKADLNAYNAQGFTPLILAAYHGHLDMVEALIGAGANACLADQNQGNTAQMGVAFRGGDAIAARLLKAGCDVNIRNRAGQTALMMATLFDRAVQVDLLLAAGADPTLADAQGRTAAAIATAQGHDAIRAKLQARSQRTP